MRRRREGFRASGVVCRAKKVPQKNIVLSPFSLLARSTSALSRWVNRPKAPSGESLTEVVRRTEQRLAVAVPRLL